IIEVVLTFTGAAYRDEIKSFVIARWRGFRRARTEDLKILTQRKLGPRHEKHKLPNPLDNANVRAIVWMLPLLALAYIWKSNKPILWFVRVGFLFVYLRLMFTVLILTAYRIKLLPRVLLQRTGVDRSVM